MDSRAFICCVVLLTSVIRCHADDDVRTDAHLQPHQLTSTASRVNVALNRPAWQSSIYFSSAYGGSLAANLANDGNRDPNLLQANCSCIHTLQDINPWWAVDLGIPFVVDSVDFTNRLRAGYRSNNFIVGLTDVSPEVKSPTLWNYDLCGKWSGAVPAGATVNFRCADNVPASRYLVVQIPQATPMNFCELEAYVRSCPNNFTYIASMKGCYRVVADNLDWSMAGLRCRSLHKDAHLVVINSAAEQSAIAGLIASTRGQNLSGCYRDNDGYLLWTAGQRMDPTASSSAFIWRVTTTVSSTAIMSEMQHTNWFAGQPSHSLGAEVQSCVAVMSARHYAWRNSWCSATYCSVCEIGA